MMSSHLSHLDSQKNQPTQDWHPADIQAALKKAGWSYARISRVNKYARSSANNAIRTPWPRMELLIATAIGTTPQLIWPSRYNEDGTPKSGRGQRGLGRYKRKASRPASNSSTARRRRNVETRGAI